MRKVALYTLGCRVNQYETEAIIETFKKLNYDIVDFDAFADIYIINTCTVTSASDKKSRQMIRKVRKLNPNAVVAAVGCYAQIAPEEVAQIEGVDVVLGTTDKGKIAQIIEGYLEDYKKIVNAPNIMKTNQFEELEIDEYQGRTRGFLKVQDGCDRYCSYCIIPYARGPVRSRKPENIYKQVEKLAANGFKEIILSGIHVASYGKDLKNVNLSDIIENISNINGIERIRIGSVEPMFFTNHTIERLSKLPKLCPHFHLSLQSGCDETLLRMNRSYSTAQYEDTVKAIRANFSDSSITTDIIVGFPGETEEEFNKTYDFIKKIKLSKTHIFKFSPRKGTKAAQFDNQVSPEFKEIRSKLLSELDIISEKEFIENHIGRTMKVLFENRDGYINNGYTINYIKVELDIDITEDLSGQILEVKLIDLKDGAALGILT
jgi:threonylcarbamoyladenosine tRNA methylthiotransferase MtaB